MNIKDTVQVSRDEIARLAYLKWESEGFPEGRSLQHWLDAERLLKTTKQVIAGNPKSVKEKNPKPVGRRKTVAV
jgi:hypothetical protein